MAFRLRRPGYRPPLPYDEPTQEDIDERWVFSDSVLGNLDEIPDLPNGLPWWAAPEYQEAYLAEDSDEEDE